jgi:hypothetical protein
LTPVKPDALGTTLHTAPNGLFIRKLLKAMENEENGSGFVNVTLKKQDYVLALQNLMQEVVEAIKKKL